MKAGKELDALVAEKVLGCEVVRYNVELTRAGCDCPDNRHGEDESSDELKPYSTDLQVAWLVVERMRGDWFSFKAWQPSVATAEGFDVKTSPDHAIVSFVCGAGPCPRHNTDFHNHHGAYDVEGDTLSEAICNAALIALKALPPQERFPAGMAKGE